jgi:hypothetical protein
LKDEFSSTADLFLRLDISPIRGATDSGVDPLIQKGDEPIGSFFPKDFNTSQIMVIVEQSDLFVDERNGGLIETTV